MPLTLAGSTLTAVTPQRVNQIGYTTVETDTQLAVDAALVDVWTAAQTAGKIVEIIVRNISGGGQTIRVGAAPVYGGAPKGLLLAPGELITFSAYSLALKAIASAPGALLDRLIVSRAS